MSEEAPKSRPEQPSDEPPALSVPSHDPLPPPPDVQYTRPTLGRQAPSQAPQTLGRAGRSEERGGSPSGKSSFTSLGAGMAAATTFVASVIAGFIIGQLIDRHWGSPGTLPWGTLVFSLLGVAAGFLNLFRVLAATDRSSKK